MKYGNKTDDPEYFRKWYVKNRKTVLEKVAQPIECECGQIVTKGNLSKHKNTEVHKRVMRTLRQLKKQ